MRSKKISKWREFENLAREVMSKHFGVSLEEKKLDSIPKKFDMVSPDGKIIGDAKFLSLVHGKRKPSAKFMEIAGHVWLLEKIEKAKKRFLVFGNQKEVPEWWLKIYGSLVHNVEFYFINENGDLEGLNIDVRK